MQKIIWPVLTAFLLCLAVGPLLIRMLQKLKFGQTIKADGPQWHMSKSGTPTMGGIMIMAAFIVAAAVFVPHWDSNVIVGMVFILLISLIGFLDDYISIAKKRNEGLTVRQKFLLQFLICGVAAVYAYQHIGSAIKLPFSTAMWDLGWCYIPIMTLLLVFMVNSSNLTDGLDGLASGVGLITFASFTLIYFFMQGLPGSENYMVLAAALTGACLGFIRFNTYPARVFMGDTGSLALGAALSWLALVGKMPLWLPIMGLTYMFSSISVMIQVIHFKRTGKRVFKMAPIHHHFEKEGYPETKITAMYMIITAVLCLIGLAAIR
ncbi:MAG: phospho-N-acetylmuramoyl-pentapeptide-transferase [Eubacteriales bacterium]|nr:phospho-N-acetylmuramoyl-pentapeptide-transferase [Eubacteriales bacterium]